MAANLESRVKKHAYDSPRAHCFVFVFVLTRDLGFPTGGYLGCGRESPRCFGICRWIANGDTAESFQNSKHYRWRRQLLTIVAVPPLPSLVFFFFFEDANNVEEVKIVYTRRLP